MHTIGHGMIVGAMQATDLNGPAVTTFHAISIDLAHEEIEGLRREAEEMGGRQGRI
jgi:hypothetical protein